MGKGSDFGVSEFNSVGTFYIGGPYTNSGSGERYIDDVRVYNKALTAQEVAMLYQEQKK